MFQVIEHGGWIQGAYRFVEDSKDPLFATVALEDLTIPSDQGWSHKILSTLLSIEKKVLDERNQRCTLTEEKKSFFRDANFRSAA